MAHGALEKFFLVRRSRHRNAKVLVSLSCCHAPAGSAENVFAAEEVGLDFVSERVGGGVHRVGDRFDPRGAAAEGAHDRLEVAAVLFGEALGVDARHDEGGFGQLERDDSVPLASAKIADPAEMVIGDAGSASAAPGEFHGGVILDLHREPVGAANEDSTKFVDGIEAERFANHEAVSEGAGEHAGAGRGADEREGL